LEQKKVQKDNLSELKLPIRVNKENPLPFDLYRRYTAAVLAGDIEMIFRRRKDQDNGQ